MCKQRYIPERLEDEIVDRYSFLLAGDRSELSLRSKKLAEHALQKMARVQSFRIGNPELGLPFSIPKNGNRKTIKESFKNLRRAYQWGDENFDPMIFDESFVRDLAGRITPDLYLGRSARYRTEDVKITGAAVIPPTAFKLVEKEIPLFEAAMQDKLGLPLPQDGLEAAIFAHFHLTRMHPFNDGNGRTARLFQDIILNHYFLPPPVIEVGERNTYYNLLAKADHDWKTQKNWENPNLVTPGEREFYTFMAGKVNVSLDKLSHALKNPH